MALHDWPLQLALTALSGAALTATSLGCSSDLPGPKICAATAPCTAGSSCVVGRCRGDGTLPAARNAPLLQFEPTTIASLSARGEVSTNESLGDALTLGRASDGEAMWLFRFALTLPDDARIQRALLVLDPLPGCEKRPGRMKLEVSNVLSAWSADTLRSQRPKIGLPMRALDAPVVPARILRVDLTELVMRWREHRRRYHGLALIAHGDSATGACFSTGQSAGRGPRLEVLLAPDADSKDAGAAAVATRRDGGVTQEATP